MRSKRPIRDVKYRVAAVCESATPARAAHTTSARFLQIVEIWLECSQQVAMDLSSSRKVLRLPDVCCGTCEQ
jgi:hypothetical protein